MFYRCIPQSDASVRECWSEMCTILIGKSFITVVQRKLQLHQKFSLIIKKLIEVYTIHCYNCTYHSGLPILS